MRVPLTTSVDISKKFTNPYNISVYNPLSQLYESATQEHDCFVLDSERISNCMYVIYNFAHKIYEQVLFMDGWQNSTTLIESEVSSCESSVSVREDSLITNKYDYIRLATNKRYQIESAVTTTENKTVFISNIKKKNLVVKNNSKKNTFDLVQIQNGNLFLLKENVQKKRNFYFQIIFENGVKRKYIQTLNGRISELERNFKPVPAFNIVSKQFDLIERVNGQINVIQENTNIELKNEEQEEKELTNAELTKKVIKLENTIKQMEMQHKKEMQAMQTQINALIAKAIVKQK
ncbi:Hypothetical_protein [Hexamita inflata]|uniref:Hypothetical_protein n=1 Tax=Hexamita inflata TaxID=28002 RepID=A0AA86TWC9_9EUKA|nr:Hypothetical protein HINF_LOCUS18436 [Hexamita inflata]